MTVTPVAMVDQYGFTFGDSAIVIQGHVIGMYLPSFFTGYLIARYGVSNVMIAGAALQLLCILVNVAGLDVWNFRIALFLVGVGWNFLFIGGTTLLTECYTPAEKAKAQGFNDLCIWGMVTVGAVVSGMLVHEIGWVMVNLAVSPLVLVVLAAVLWLKLSGHEKAAPVAAE
jgi:MFS family permease